MKKSFAVIGLGSFGQIVVKTLVQLGAEVIAIDKNFEIIDGIKDEVLIAVQMDSTDRESLEELDLKSVEAAIVAMGSGFEEALLTVVTLKQIGVSKVICRARSSIRKQILEQIGCDTVLLPEEEVGRNLAKDLVTGLFFERVEVSEDYHVAQLVAPEDFIGKSVSELKLREKYHLNIVAINRRISKPGLLKEESMEQMTIIPDPEDLILESDTLVLFGHDKDFVSLADTVRKNSK
jgi:trk system potassium uptake protein TrkA